MYYVFQYSTKYLIIENPYKRNDFYNTIEFKKK